jgi:hypothetical protein
VTRSMRQHAADWAFREKRVRHSAEHPFAEPAVPVPASDQQIGAFLAYNAQKFAGNRAACRSVNLIGYVHTVACEICPDVRERLLGPGLGVALLDAKAAGFKVYAVIDASGDPSELVSRTTLARFPQAGVVPTSANAVLSEIHRTWNRPEAAELAKLYALATPHYAAVIESYQKTQEVAKQSIG